MPSLSTCPNAIALELWAMPIKWWNILNLLNVKTHLFLQVKDCYIMPLGKDQEVPPALLPLEGQGLPQNRTNLLLSILVCNLFYKTTPQYTIWDPALNSYIRWEQNVIDQGTCSPCPIRSRCLTCRSSQLFRLSLQQPGDQELPIYLLPSATCPLLRP